MTVSTMKESGMIWGCENNDDCGTPIVSRVFVQAARCKEFSVIQRRACCVWIGGGKNGLRQLRSDQSGLVRSQAALGAGFGVRGLSNLLGHRGASDRLPAVRKSEAREARLAGGQSVLQQAVCLLCRAALPGHDDQRCGSRNTPELEDHQRAGQAVHARATAQDRCSNAQGHWSGRNFHTQRAHLSDRRQ